MIQNGNKPQWYNRPFKKTAKYWKERWCIPRSERTDVWKEFSFDKYLKKTEKLLQGI